MGLQMTIGTIFSVGPREIRAFMVDPGGPMVIIRARISMHYQTLKHACIHALSYDQTCTMEQKNNTNMQY